MKRILFVFALIPTLLLLGPSPASAITGFYREFRKKYVEDNDNEDFVRAVTKAKCTICHDAKTKKKRNAYGEELSQLLDKDKDKGDLEKIQKALETVAKLPVDPKDKKGITYGDLIQQGKLPADEKKK